MNVSAVGTVVHVVVSVCEAAIVTGVQPRDRITVTLFPDGRQPKPLTGPLDRDAIGQRRNTWHYTEECRPNG